MHALVHVQKTKNKMANEASNLTLSNTYFILYKLDLILLSHHPLLDIVLIFLSNNYGF